MELIPAETNIDFLRRAPLCAALSLGAIALSAVMWFVWGGFKLGIEFAGGTVIEVAFADAEPNAVEAGLVRSAMADLGYPDASVVRIGDPAENAFQISLKVSEEEASQPGAAPAGNAAISQASGVVAASEQGTAQSGESTSQDSSQEPQVAASSGSEDEAESDPENVSETAPEGESAAAGADSPPAGDAEGSSSAEVPEAENEPSQVADSTAGAAAAAAVSPGASRLIDQVLASLEATVGKKASVNRIEQIGPRVGDELTRQGFLAVFIVGVLILGYIALRFDMRYAPGAVAALLHDITITAGFFVIFQLEFNLQVLAAILAVLGYSLNDTIVVYDRIRENVERRGSTQLSDVINQSVNQTLSRSLLTSFTTLLVVVALLVLGGPVIRDFAIAMLVGIVVGTYSSIYVASALLLAIQERWKPASA